MHYRVKVYTAQQCLPFMIKQWRVSLNVNWTCATVLTDLSKAFDCFLHDLLIAKLYTCGCDIPSLKLLNCYLSKRRQRVKINNFYSSCAEIYLESHKDLP